MRFILKNSFKAILVLFILSHVSILSYAKYNRGEWKHWTDDDKNCLNTREEILVKSSLLPIVYKDSKKCSIISGMWIDFYSNESLREASDIDIDHIIPLKHADDLIGRFWDSEQKKRFANDPDNLVITNKKFNRSKGSKTILEWLPSNRSRACAYVKKWHFVKDKYKIKIESAEKRIIKEVCEY